MARKLTDSSSLARLGIAATLVDATMALARDRQGSAVLLLASAALSSRVPGLGVAVSVLLRLYRRLR